MARFGSERLPLPDGTEVDIMTSREAVDERSQAMDDQSWDVLTQLLSDCAINTGIPDLSSQHYH